MATRELQDCGVKSSVKRQNWDRNGIFK